MRYETSIELPNSSAMAGVELAGAEDANVLNIQSISIGPIGQKGREGYAHVQGE